MRKSHTIKTLGFDADDTLWESEQFFKFTQQEFSQLLAEFADQETISKALLTTERRNLAFYGYGIKGFILSLIETAITLTEQRVSAAVIAKILALGHAMSAHPLEPRASVRETLSLLKKSYTLTLITKGDLFDQERKLAESGLAEFFDQVEIVSEKTSTTYGRIFYPCPQQSVMIGNSLRSDILPALNAGCFAIYLPHSLTWELEQADYPKPQDSFQDRFYEATHFSEIPQILERINLTT